MSMINHMIVEKREKEKINKEIIRNVSISDEVTDLAIETQNTREVIIDNLMFDYLIRVDELDSLDTLCSKVKVNFTEVLNVVRVESIRLLMDDFSTTEIFAMSWDDVANNLIRINKRLILSKIKEEYPDVYYPILERAKETADKIIRGIN